MKTAAFILGCCVIVAAIVEAWSYVYVSMPLCSEDVTYKFSSSRPMSHRRTDNQSSVGGY